MEMNKLSDWMKLIGLFILGVIFVCVSAYLSKVINN